MREENRKQKPNLVMHLRCIKIYKYRVKRHLANEINQNNIFLSRYSWSNTKVGRDLQFMTNSENFSSPILECFIVIYMIYKLN